MLYTVEFEHATHMRRASISSTSLPSISDPKRARAEIWARTGVAIKLRFVLEHEHGVKARFIQSLPVSLQLSPRKAWSGVVCIFSLRGYSFAKRAYSWLDRGPDGAERILTVLHVPPVIGPHEAVELAMVKCCDQLR